MRLAGTTKDIVAHIIAFLNILDDDPRMLFAALACQFSASELERMKRYWIKNTIFKSTQCTLWQENVVNGIVHSWNGRPALEWYGAKIWYRKGERHRDVGPAVEFVNGFKQWFRNGMRHREGGPAVEWSGGTKEWWQNGIFLQSERSAS